MTDLIPAFTRYSVGDCEMRPNPGGGWVQVSDILRLIDWLTDEDNAETMLIKLDYLREAVA